MRKKGGLVMGMIGAGGVSRSFLSRMPVLLGGMGPVKAASFRVARRIANTLRSGHAVMNYAAMEPCDLIWIAVPDAGIDRVSRDLAAATPLAGKVAVLCGSTRDSFWPGPLLAGGARVATRKLIELRAASKALYLSGVHLATYLLLPWIAASVESLRDAGLSRMEATHVASALGGRALRAYAKAGPKAWSPVAADRLRLSIARDLDTIRGVDPKLAALYADGVEQALRYFESRK
jgi:hypothetical protein